MAFLEGKLYNADDDLPQRMVFYEVARSSRPSPPSPGDPAPDADDIIAGEGEAGTNRRYAVSGLRETEHYCWLPDRCGDGRWALRTNVDPPHVVQVVEPYTWFVWRAPDCP